MSTCRWIACDRDAYNHQVCRRHHDRTMNAGRRAARGADRATVLRSVARYARPDAPIQVRLDELEGMLDRGDAPDSAARQCGWSRESARDVARRYDRPDLAERLLRSPTPIRDRLEDLEFLLDHGEDGDRAARRCGWSRESALSIARRHDRPDLADRLLAEAVPA